MSGRGGERHAGHRHGCSPRRPEPDAGQSTVKLAPVEIFYTGLLVAVALLITWFAVYVVYRLLHEDK